MREGWACAMTNAGAEYQVRLDLAFTRSCLNAAGGGRRKVRTGRSFAVTRCFLGIYSFRSLRLGCASCSSFAV